MASRDIESPKNTRLLRLGLSGVNEASAGNRRPGDKKIKHTWHRGEGRTMQKPYRYSCHHVILINYQISLWQRPHLCGKYSVCTLPGWCCPVRGSHKKSLTSFQHVPPLSQVGRDAQVMSVMRSHGPCIYNPKAADSRRAQKPARHILKLAMQRNVLQRLAVRPRRRSL